MCAPSQGAMLPYGLKVPSPYFPFGPSGGLTQVHLSALDFQRSQMNDYNVRVPFGLRNYQNSVGLSSFHAYFNDPYTQAYFYKHDPRARFVQEEPKPSHSYIGLIGMAILNSKEKKLVLSDIYQWILDNYPYFRTRGPGWRNSIRHNLSLNDCFIKSGRSANGKGHYWAVHPANVEDFERGDFRRRRAQRKVRRHMGLSVPDDDDSPTPSPTQAWSHHDMVQDSDVNHIDPISVSTDHSMTPIPTRSDSDHLVLSHSNPTYGPVPGQPRKPSRKRLFDMASLLAPDDDEEDKNIVQETHNEKLNGHGIHASGFMFHPIQEQKPHDMKTDPSSGKNAENIDSSSAHNLAAIVYRTPSDNGKEMNFSDDDHENDEIQVTSGEDSPAQEPDDIYTSGVFSVGNKYENEKNSFNANKFLMEKGDQQTTKNSSSPQNTESKSENALDLSSLTNFGNEKKQGMSTNKVDVIKNFECKVFGHSLRLKEDGVRLLQHTGKTDESQMKEEAGCEKCSGYGGTEMNDRCIISPSKANCSSCEHIKQIDSDTLMSKLSYRDRCEPRGEQLCSVINGGIDHVKSSADKLHYYRSELHDSRGAHNHGHGDSNFRPLDNGLVESDRNCDGDTRGLTSESSLFVSEAARVSSDDIRWTDMSKSVISRNRFSAFSTLGIRNHGMYSPFQLRNFSLTPHRLVPTATPMRAGISDPVLPASATSSSASVALIKGLDSGVGKGSHVTNNITNGNNNNNNNCTNNRD